MARPASRHPTDLELAILKVLWRNGPQSVRQVQQTLADPAAGTPPRELAYTSVMTVMNIMTRKRYLRRAKDGGSYIYQPRIGEQATGRRMLDDLVQRVFDGSAASVVHNLLETAELDETELQKLRELINRRM